MVARRAASAPSLSPGTIVADRYRIGPRCGTGGMAEVFQAIDLRTGRQVALKALRRELASHPAAVARMRREAAVLSSLHHPAVVAAVDSGTLQDGRLFLVMEFVHGPTLNQWAQGRLLQPADLSPVLAGVSAALAATHKSGVVHRDLKPENIMLQIDTNESDLRVKLVDFGISKIYQAERLTGTGEVVGTPRYMAPEQLTGERDLDLRVDVYALGVILYEALAGHPPFDGKNPNEMLINILNGRHVPLRAHRPDVPPAIESIIARAMAKRREKRFGSTVELANAWLEQAVSAGAPEPRQARSARTLALGSMGGSAGVSPEHEAHPARYETLHMPSAQPSDPPGLAASSPSSEPLPPVPGLPSAGSRRSRWLLIGLATTVVLAATALLLMAW